MKHYFVAACLFFLFCSSCQHNSNLVVKREISTKKNASTVKKTVFSKNKKIQLQDHQIRTIDYLYHKKDQRGLLVNHYLGTGKTILALSFCAKYPDKKAVVILPRFLKAHWQNQIKLLGLSSNDFEFYGYNELEKIKDKDFSQNIVVVDESHKLVDLLESKNLNKRVSSSKVYLGVQKAHKILALTGTPIFSNVSNIAHQINLVSGEMLLETNKEKFNSKYMTSAPARSFFRGQLLESLIFSKTLALFSMNIPNLLPLSRMGNLLSSVGLSLAVPLSVAFLSNKYSLDNYGLRIFNVEKLKSLTEKYVSFYGFEKSKTSSSDYPSKTINLEDFYYSLQQYMFYLSCLDKGLSIDETWYLLRDDSHTKDLVGDKKYLSLNINSTQEALLAEAGFGREIANIIFQEKGKILIPEKFEKLFRKSQEKKGPIAIYSHYYRNGLLLFSKFLRSKGVADKNISIIHPDDSVEEQNKVIHNYNLGKTKYLLIHPEITEGISLKGTAQIHFLETPINKSFQEQVIGRAIRYRSHHHLPEKDRHVDVYIWRAILNNNNIKNWMALRYNWYEKYRELNYYSSGGAIGRSQLDFNSLAKSKTADQTAFSRLESLSFSMESLRTLLVEYSIEKLQN